MGCLMSMMLLIAFSLKKLKRRNADKNSSGCLTSISLAISALGLGCLSIITFWMA